MKAVLTKLQNLLQRVRDLFPSKLPQGMTEFNAFADAIVKTYNLPASENDVRYTLSAMIINGGSASPYRSRYAFVLAIEAAISKQVAGAAFQEIQVAQREKMKAEQAATQKPAEVTALHAVPSDGQQK